MENTPDLLAARAVDGDEVAVAGAVRGRVVARGLDEGEGGFVPGLGGERVAAGEVEDVHFVLVGPVEMCYRVFAWVSAGGGGDGLPASGARVDDTSPPAIRRA